MSAETGALIAWRDGASGELFKAPPDDLRAMLGEVEAALAADEVDEDKRAAALEVAVYVGSVLLELDLEQLSGAASLAAPVVEGPAPLRRLLADAALDSFAVEYQPAED